jgi:hypothetical protein
MYRAIPATDAYRNQVGVALDTVRKVAIDLDRLLEVPPVTWACVEPVREITAGLETILQNLKKLHVDP